MIKAIETKAFYSAKFYKLFVIYVSVHSFHLISFLLFLYFCSIGSNGLAEWGIIELQGDLEVRGDDQMNGQFIGDLNYDKYGQPVNN